MSRAYGFNFNPRLFKSSGLRLQLKLVKTVAWRVQNIRSSARDAEHFRI